MGVRYLQNSMPSVANVLSVLKTQYPNVNFVKGNKFAWSPSNKTVTYHITNTNDTQSAWALIHEVAHASLNHIDYKSDVDLLRHEVAAWQEAKTMAIDLGVPIDEDHIQDCLDTYRDWLHKRATCPSCNVVGLQRSDGTYGCFNCQTSWKVPSSPLCRVSRTIVTS